MKYTKLFFAVMLIITMIACQNEEGKKATEESTKAGHKVTVLEAINGNTYTYLLVSEKGNEYWAAISKRDTKVGETLYFSDALEMQNFKSKELDRTFDTITFVSKINEQPITMGGAMRSAKAKSGKPGLSKEEISIEPAEGGITIAELYAKRASYNEKEVIVRGKVVKFSSGIMNRNWAHIQDGTSDNENFDLTITTKENLKVGDVVTLKGTIAVSKDFGAGYFYEVIMESAETVKTK